MSSDPSVTVLPARSRGGVSSGAFQLATGPRFAKLPAVEGGESDRVKQIHLFQSTQFLCLTYPGPLTVGLVRA